MIRSILTVCFAVGLAIVCGWIPPALAQPLHPHVAQSAFKTPSAASLAAFSSGGMSLFSFSGDRPTNLGVKSGNLLACPGTPNCVSSQSSDAAFKVEPLAYSGSAQAWTELKSIIASLPRTQIIEQTNDYLYVEFASALMGFVDDVEFYRDESAGVIHVRSASRLGKSDLGVNRKRVEEIRSKLAQAVKM